MHHPGPASMRPSDITDGIARAVAHRPRVETSASMRPSDITDGIPRRYGRSGNTPTSSFNEAVGYYRRNRWPHASVDRSPVASMRPSDITDGIPRMFVTLIPRERTLQ